METTVLDWSLGGVRDIVTEYGNYLSILVIITRKNYHQPIRLCMTDNKVTILMEIGVGWQFR